MKTIFFYSSIILLLVFSSCKKDELTLPSDVLFKFGIAPYETNESDAQMYQKATSSNLILNKGLLLLSAIEFDGKRDEGQDVFFISNFTRTVVANLENESTNFDVKFDVPQGVYSKVDVTIHLDNSTSTAVIVEGTIAINGGIPIPLKFEYAFPDQVRIRALPPSGQSIVLRKDQRSVARVILDASYLFRFTNPNLLANADVINENGKPLILINSSNNKPIFNQIASRISSSFIVIFE
jgi:hypothetical protein